LFVVEDLGVGDAAAVIDCGVEVALADTGVAPVRVVASSMNTPPTAVRDRSELLDVNVDQLARQIALIPLHRPSIRGTVATVQAAHTSPVQDALDG
jgi:hypothetical protein